MKFLVLLLLSCCFLAANGAEAVDAAVARWSAEAGKVQAVYDQAVDKLTAAGIKDASALAIARAKKNDLIGTAAAWTVVLRMDRLNEDARRFFTATGTLATVLKKLDNPAVDLLGANAPEADDKEVERIATRFDKGLADETAHRAEAFAKADKTALRELERLAERALAQGDITAANAAWLEVLRLKRDHEDARAFFAKVGQLDQTLAELAKAGDPHADIVPLMQQGQGLVLRYTCTPAAFVLQGGKLLLKDLSGGKQDGTVAGLTEKPKTPFLACNGQDTQVEVGDVPFTKSIPFSVAVWFRPAAPGGALVSKYISGSWNGFMLFLEGDVVSAWMLKNRFVWAAVSNEVSQTKGYRYQLDHWQQVVVTVNESGMTMYANGAKVVRSPWNGKPTVTTEATPMVIGAFGRRFFKGDIGEVAIWRQALGEDDVRTLYLVGAQKYK